MNLISLFPDADDHQRLAAGVQIFSEGDPGDSLFVVVDGLVDLTFDGTTFAQLGPGELFGEMALIDDQPRSLSAVAVTECVLAEVDERRFLFLVNEAPTFALHVMSVMANRLRNA